MAEREQQAKASPAQKQGREQRQFVCNVWYTEGFVRSDGGQSASVSTTMSSYRGTCPGWHVGSWNATGNDGYGNGVPALTRTAVQLRAFGDVIDVTPPFHSDLQDRVPRRRERRALR
ncbi:hypothetical protein CPLU01_02679 [Colletotrichum plurivorum]|uniref:Uncharacterized protein n=1 Tax=Colletotrichum plurivorum TaxID=2175906 RepID=A0A8H6KVK9_9PEZI|nr:hypothetical protein CPLU01_02679 [Colletotrichum plurivorum]